MGCKTCMSIAVTFVFLADVDGKSLIRGLPCEQGLEHAELDEHIRCLMFRYKKFNISISTNILFNKETFYF